jgi:periplasmic protein TonB
MRTWTLVVSVCAHAVVVAAIFVSPILATTDLPAPRRPLVFEAITPVIVPTVPAPARPQSAEPSTAAHSIPTTEPRDLPPDTPAPISDPSADVVAQGGTGVPTDSFGPVGDSVIAPPPTPARRDPVPVGGVIRPPTRVVYVQPVYPPFALAARKEGTVILQAVIDEMGNVREVKVLRSVQLLDDAALQAVANWKFTPTLLNGTAVPVVMTVTVGFTLTK